MLTAALAAAWTMQSFVAGAASDPEPVPRVAIDAQGHTLAAWTTHGRLVASRRNGGRPKTVARGVYDYAVASGAVAYVAKDGVHVNGRLVDRYKGDEIDGVAIAADPLGGYVVAERRFVNHDWQVRVDGQDLGQGSFGLDARPTSALAVGPDGTARLVFESDAGVSLATRPHGGTWTVTPVAGKNLGEPRISGDTITTLAKTLCGDVTCAGSPLAGGSGPALRYPNRAFAPWGTADGLVYLYKEHPRAFSREAPVRLYAGGKVSYLTHDSATEPIALALSGRSLALWTTRTRWGAALFAGGAAHRVAAPPGSGPSIYHSNSTNRDARAAGDYVAVAWARGGVVRLAVRKFPHGGDSRGR